MAEHPVPRRALESHTGVLGKTGTGKTYTARGLAEMMLDAGRQVVIVDPTGAWWGLRSDYEIPIFGGAHGDVEINDKAGDAVAAVIFEQGTSAIVDLSAMTGGAQRRFMTAFAHRVREEKISRDPAAFYLILDEADEFLPQTLQPDMMNLFGDLKWMVRRARVRGVRVMMVTQRPAEIAKSVLTQIETLIVHRLTAPQDRKAIEEWVKGHSDPGAAKEVLSSLASLDRGEAWIWAPDLDILKRSRIPANRSYDSSATPDASTGPVTAPALASLDLSAIRSAMVQDPEQQGKPQKAKAADGAALSALNNEIAVLTSERDRYGAALAEAYQRFDHLQSRLIELVDAAIILRNDAEAARMAAKLPLGGQAGVEAYKGKPSVVPDLKMPKYEYQKPAAAGSVGSVSVTKAAKPRQDALPLPEGATLNAAALQIASLLKAIAPDKSPWTDVLVLLGFRPGSGWISKAYKQLIELGYMDGPVNGPLSATQHCCNDDAIPIGMWPTPSEVRALWREKLRGPGGTIADWLAKHGPATKAEIGAGIGMSPSSGWFGKGIKDATRSNLISKDGERFVANPLLVD